VAREGKTTTMAANVQRSVRTFTRIVEDLRLAIDEYLRVHNRDPKPFVWTASVQSIIDKLNRCKVISETLH